MATYSFKDSMSKTVFINFILLRELNILEEKKDVSPLSFLPVVHILSALKEESQNNKTNVYNK